MKVHPIPRLAVFLILVGLLWAVTTEVSLIGASPPSIISLQDAIDRGSVRIELECKEGVLSVTLIATGAADQECSVRARAGDIISVPPMGLIVTSDLDFIILPGEEETIDVGDAIQLLDETPPEIHYTLDPEPNEYGWNKDIVAITVTADDKEGGLGIKEIYYKVGTESPVLVDTDQLTFSECGRAATYSLKVSEEGAQRFEFWAVDQAGYESEHQVLTVRIDMTKPSINITPAPETYIGRVTVRWSISDSLSRLARCDVVVDGSSVSSSCSSSLNLEVGSHQVEIDAEDKAGNVESVSYRYSVISIQQAIDRATSGDTINIGSGTFEENFKITKSITLKGQGTVIKGAKKGYPVVLIKSGTVKIESLTIANATRYSDSSSCAQKDSICPWGIRIQGGANVTISNCRIRDNASVGVKIAGSARATISESTITGNMVGVGVSDSARATISDSTIRNNRFDGITVGKSAQATIEGSTISSNAIAGIGVSRSARITIEGSTICYSGRGGIRVVGNAQATIRNNKIYGSGREGIWVYGGSARVTIEGNKINGNTQHGIEMNDSPQATINNNQISNNGGCGVYLCWASYPHSVWNFTGTISGKGNRICHNEGGRTLCPEDYPYWPIGFNIGCP